MVLTRTDRRCMYVLCGTGWGPSESTTECTVLGVKYLYSQGGISGAHLHGSIVLQVLSAEYVCYCVPLQEYEIRPQIIEKVKKDVDLKLMVAKAWADVKPWINETDRNDVEKKVRTEVCPCAVMLASHSW